jgi:nicotinamidase-related amidase
MDNGKKALILIGFQNDYFAEDGILRAAVEESSRTNRVLEHTVELLKRAMETEALIIETPIIFTETYEELVDPVGILKTIKDVGAFKAGSSGSETIPEIRQFGDRIQAVPGKRGLNAFSNTDLDAVLEAAGVEEIVLAGTVTSICIDSTGRAAHERGYRVTVLTDCTSSRTNFEQGFYCENVFPLYARTCTSAEFLAEMI